MSKTPHPYRKLSHRQASTLPLETCHRIEQFLLLEAELLDCWEFEAWLDLFAHDIHYWAPVRENRTMRELHAEMHSPGAGAHFDEDIVSLRQRVKRVTSQRAWAESPPSRTRHLVTNVRAYADDEEPGAFAVESSFCVYRTSGEKGEDWIVGKRFDRLRPADTAAGLCIARRTVVFDMATILIKNLSSFY